MNKLQFNLHTFHRVTWASAKLQNEWENKLKHLAKLIEDIRCLPEMLDILPLQIRFIDRAALYTFKKNIEANELFCSIIEHLPVELKYVFLNHHHELTKVPVLIGERSAVIRFEGDLTDYNSCLRQLKLADEYQAALSAFFSYRLSDVNWGMLLDEQHAISSTVEAEQALLNPYWKSFGIYLSPVLPLGNTCKTAISVAQDFRKIVSKYLDPDLFSALEEILSWPVEWSALHGIAEIKTPLFKTIYDTDATAGKYISRLTSSTYPQFAENGILFPYKQPAKLYFSESRSFKSGIDYLKNSL